MRTTFVTSSPRQELLPDLGLPEVAFLGRSNVGKSSLLNALVSARVARTSSTPGRTQHINLFSVHAGFGDFALADLPGYGFAKAPGHVRAQWGDMVERYLEHRHELRAALLLIDARRGVQPTDRELFEALYRTMHDRGALAPVVLTKIDKLPKSKRKPLAASVAAALRIDRDMVSFTSSSDRVGLDELLRRFSAWVGGQQTESIE
ncbi:MAG: ribosome biogenesis GTP-binding protein YihA/YsxC [Myxococcota bacterium]